MQIFSILNASLIASMVGLVQAAVATAPKEYSMEIGLAVCFNRNGGGGLYLRTACKPGDEGTVFIDMNHRKADKTVESVVGIKLTEKRGLKLGWDRKTNQLVTKNNAKTYDDVYTKDLAEVCIRYLNDETYSVFRLKNGNCPGARMTTFVMDQFDPKTQKLIPAAKN